VLFQFGKLGENGSVGDTVSYKWVHNKQVGTPTQDEQPGMEPPTMRAALLAWLVEAFQAKGLNPETPET
jgi:hypothetical protein